MSIIKITSTGYFFIIFYLLTGLPDYQQVALDDGNDRLTADKLVADAHVRGTGQIESLSLIVQAPYRDAAGDIAESEHGYPAALTRLKDIRTAADNGEAVLVADEQRSAAAADDIVSYGDVGESVVEQTAHGSVYDKIGISALKAKLYGVTDIGIILADVELYQIFDVRSAAAGVEVTHGYIGRHTERHYRIIALIGGYDEIAR